MEIIPQSLFSVFSDNYFSIHLALVLNNKIRVSEERTQTKIPICEQSHPQATLWGKWCIFFLCIPTRSFCQALSVSHYKFLVLTHITSPENLFSKESNPLNILQTLLKHTWLHTLMGTISVTSNIFLSFLHVSKFHPSFKVPLKSHLFCVSLPDHIRFFKNIAEL